MSTLLLRMSAAIVAGTLALTVWLVPAGANGPRFFPDDPLGFDPETQDASHVQPWKLQDQYDFIENTFFRPGEQRDVRALNVNTIDEVPDSSWFTNRLGLRAVTIDELVRGPLTSDGPIQPWTVIGGKSEGITPGLRIRDAEGIVYFIKFDPPRYPRMATGAEVISTRFFHAFGYHVAENFLAVLRPEQLTIDPSATLVGPAGKPRPITDDDLDRLFAKAAREPDGSYRVVASRSLPGKDLGPFRYWGTRPDDPNDIFPHEHRRELRGLRVFAAWLNHDDSRSINTRDFLVERKGRAIVWHHLLDFGSTLGSGSTQAQKPRAGNEYIWEARPTFLTMMTLGFYVRPWLRVKYPEMPAVGRIEADFFEPDRWKPEYPNPAFDNLRADDAFWAARRIALIRDDAIRAVVATGELGDPAAAEYLVNVLSKRRDKVVTYWLNGVLPIVDPELSRDGVLTFRNIAVDAGYATRPEGYLVQWSRFDNATWTATPIGPEQMISEPRAVAPADALESPFVVAELRSTHPTHAGWSIPTRVYFRRETGGWQTIGIDRQ